jgi:hypothetical protein
MKRWWLVVGALALIAALATMAYRAWSTRAAADGVEHFLAEHWAAPLAPQGAPPAGFLPLEASLAPADCGHCHPVQFQDWRGSLHAQAIGPGILWQFRIMKQGEANECLRCHAPLAEQKALMAREQNWPAAPAAPPPPYVPPDLHRQGLVCAACHVRAHRRYGPPPRVARAPGGMLPHAGFVAQPAFEDSRFCAACHQFPPQGRRLNGKLLEDTYEEWRASPAAADGETCQSCHMPDRRHLWRGIHDPQMVRGGVQREIEVERVAPRRLRVRAELRSTAVGHDFPTYAVPKIYVSLWLLRQGTERGEIAQRVIGRTVSVDMDREISDTRLRPGEALVIETQAPFAPGTDAVELRVQVAPAEHYERMFRDWLARPATQDRATAALLRAALHQAESSRYRLDSLVVPIPARPGVAQRRIAK